MKINQRLISIFLVTVLCHLSFLGAIKQSFTPTVYVATVTQSGGNDPVATVLDNNTGATFTFARVSTGIYTCTASNTIFEENKTSIKIGPLKVNTGGVPGVRASVVQTVRTSTTVITFTTKYQDAADSAGDLIDGALLETAFDVSIYQ